MAISDLVILHELPLPVIICSGTNFYYVTLRLFSYATHFLFLILTLNVMDNEM